VEAGVLCKLYHRVDISTRRSGRKLVARQRDLYYAFEKQASHVVVPTLVCLQRCQWLRAREAFRTALLQDIDS